MNGQKLRELAVFAVVGTFFLVFALGGLVSEFIGGYWGPFR